MTRIRPARSTDAMAIVSIIEDRLPDSRYAGIAQVDAMAARKLFAYAAQRHGGTNDGATFLMVAEDDEGEVEAFMLGSLARVYMVFDILAASDSFLLGRKECDPRAMPALLDAYIAWAEANPRVVEIGLSWADTIPGHEAIIHAYERRGFTLCSKAFRRATQAATTRKEAA